MYKKGFNDGVGALAQYLTDHACLYDLDNHHSFEGIDIDEMESYVEEVRRFAIELDDWIPCDILLPIKNGAYQVTRQIKDCGKAYRIITASYFDGQNTWHDDNRVNHGREYLNDVIAWKPLPEAYQG